MTEGFSAAVLEWRKEREEEEAHLKGEDVPLDTDANEIRRLAALPPLDYERQREARAKMLKVRVSELDKLVEKERAAGEKIVAAGDFDDPEPHRDPVKLNKLLDEIETAIARFIVCDEETRIAATLWVVLTWNVEHVDIVPIAAINAPDKQCGKTQLLTFIGRTCRRNLPASNISPAAMFRAIEKWNPTLTIDEADTFLSANEELRGIINSGHTRDTAFVVRAVGDGANMDVQRFSTFGSKAIAGIGKLQDTIMDRSIVLTLRRKLKTENVERLRHAGKGFFETIRAKLARAAVDYGRKIGQARPDLPDELSDRAQDNWEPLLAIADLAGEQWGKRARHAAVKISNIDNAELSTGQEILKSVRDVFERHRWGNLSNEALLASLIEEPDLPWQTYNNGKPLTASQLRKKLAEYGVASKKVHCVVMGKSLQGFPCWRFVEPWTRYLSGDPPDALLRKAEEETAKGAAAGRDND